MKRYSFIVIVFTVLALIIPFSDTSVQIQADESEYYTKIKRGLTYFRKVYEKIQSNYVEEIDPYEFAKAGIEGMLASLDPYTVFIEQEGDTRLRIITTGKYGGLGMEIGLRNDRVTVISPMDNSPAQRAGIRAGDIIEKINGESVSDLVPEAISKRLRGPVGSAVEITFLRPGYDSEIILSLKREEIVIEDVSFADFIKPGIAYVRLTGFTEKAGDEFVNEIKRLQSQNEIRGFVLDLRGNSGGLLESAVDISGVFLPKNTTVVYTKGIRDGEHSFKTSNQPILPDVPLAVLVNGGSASASEIVAGALQDLDRAIIIGTNTFGKGLVQKVYNIDKNSNTKLKVTTAKYYIPSGRCVQKTDYSQDNLIFAKDSPDSNQVPPKKEYFTNNHRLVFENGGITPDRFVLDDSVSYLVTELWRNSIPFNYAVKYKLDHPSWTGKFEITEKIFNQFVTYVAESDFDYKVEGENELKRFIEIQRKNKVSPVLIKEAEQLLNRLKRTKEKSLEMHKDEISNLLLREFSEKYFGNKEKFRYTLQNDTQLGTAFTVLNDQEEYKKILAIK